ncbi:MAG: K(+)-transporting ATPase subunit C [Pseudonocardiaceae bacterium]
MSALLRQAGAGLRVLLVLTVLTGVVYPLAVWGTAHLPGLASRAEGSQLELDGQPVGSALIGVDLVAADPNTDPWFHTRPSASASDALGPGDPSTSGGSNKATSNPELTKLIEQRRTLIATRETVAPSAVPPDAVTASASGVDPHISPAYAALQVPRVARVNGLSEQRVRDLVDAHTDRPFLSFLGEAGVNVLRLNIAVRQERRAG